MFKYYLETIKPGIVIGNIILILGSFLFSSQYRKFNFILFLSTILGASLVISSACVFNNIIDCDIDKKMIRTKGRVLPKKLLTLKNVLFFAIFLGITGILILGFLVNILSMMASIIGFFIYVIFYTYYYKRKTIHATLIGSLSGSMPSVIGRTAVTNTIDLCSVLLFIIFIFWQMSHFYSIAIIRIKDYKNAKIPVFPLVKGILLTKKHIFFYIVNFIFFSLLLTIFGYLSVYFFCFLSIINIYWLFVAYISINNNNKKNSQQLFYLSIVVVFLFNLLISIDFLF